MQIVNGEDAKRIISEYFADFSNKADVKPLMIYAGDVKVLDDVRRSVERDMFSGRVYRMSDEELDSALNTGNGDYTKKDLYVCYNYSNGQFSDKQVAYAYQLAVRDNKPLVFFGDKYCFPEENNFEDQFDVYEIQ